MKLYTTIELAREFGLTRQRITQLRTSGVLNRGEHWHWIDGRVMHTEAAREALRERRRK